MNWLSLAATSVTPVTGAAAALPPPSSPPQPVRTAAARARATSTPGRRRTALTSPAAAGPRAGRPAPASAAEPLALGGLEVPAQVLADERLGVAGVLAEHLHQHPDLAVVAAVGRDHAPELDHHQVEQVVLLELAFDLGVVAAGVVAERRVDQLVLDGHVGGQGGRHRGDGPVAGGVAALGGLVGLELPLDPLVQGGQHPGRVRRRVHVDRPQDPRLRGRTGSRTVACACAVIGILRVVVVLTRQSSCSEGVPVVGRWAALALRRPRHQGRARCRRGRRRAGGGYAWGRPSSSGPGPASGRSRPASRRWATAARAREATPRTARNPATRGAMTRRGSPA